MNLILQGWLELAWLKKSLCGMISGQTTEPWKPVPRLGENPCDQGWNPWGADVWTSLRDGGPTSNFRPRGGRDCGPMTILLVVFWKNKSLLMENGPLINDLHLGKPWFSFIDTTCPRPAMLNYPKIIQNGPIQHLEKLMRKSLGFWGARFSDKAWTKP